MEIRAGRWASIASNQHGHAPCPTGAAAEPDQGDAHTVQLGKQRLIQDLQTIVEADDSAQ
jgi:hypothetical protein